MKNFVVMLVILISFFATTKSNAQVSSKRDTLKFNVSKIIVLTAPDESDSSFIEASVREELIRAKKIRVTNNGDTLYIKLLVQYQEPKENYSVPLCRDKKYGEVCLFVSSKNGSASGTGRNYVEVTGCNLYYQTLQELSSIVAGKFVFINY